MKGHVSTKYVSHVLTFLRKCDEGIKGFRAAVDLDSITRTILEEIFGVISKIPGTSEQESKDPQVRCRLIVHEAAAKAGLVSAGLALPPGPLGMLTIIPDVVKIWKIQRQMIADIAGAFGREGVLTRELMLYCLFKHVAGHVLRDLFIRAGDRIIVQRLTRGALQKVMQKVGLEVSERVAGRVASRWLLIAGAVGIGGYAFWDTARVGSTAVTFFKDLTRREQDARPALS